MAWVHEFMLSHECVGSFYRSEDGRSDISLYANEMDDDQLRHVLMSLRDRADSWLQELNDL